MTGREPLVLAFLQASPQILQATDSGRFYAGTRDSLIAGNLLCAIAFGILRVLLMRNARKKLEA